MLSRRFRFQGEVRDIRPTEPKPVETVETAVQLVSKKRLRQNRLFFYACQVHFTSVRFYWLNVSGNYVTNYALRPRNSDRLDCVIKQTYLYSFFTRRFQVNKTPSVRPNRILSYGYFTRRIVIGIDGTKTPRCKINIVLIRRYRFFRITVIYLHDRDKLPKIVNTIQCTTDSD